MSRPVPVADELGGPYWEAAARHELTAARCAACQGFWMPPVPVCPRCGSTGPAWAWTPVSGFGTVRSWTVVRQSFLPGFDVPFTLVDVLWDDQDGVRTVGRFLDDRLPEVGTEVRTVFEDVAPGVAVPAFVRRAAS